VTGSRQWWTFKKGVTCDTFSTTQVWPEEYENELTESVPVIQMDKDHVVVTWFYSDTTGRVEEEMYTSDKVVQFQGYYKPWKFLDHHVPVAPLDKWEIQKVYGMLDEWAELVKTAGHAAMRGENKTLVTRCDLKFTSFQPVVKSKPRET
jgi:hypothetical protein